jgi:hypothetical protein
MQAGGWHDQSGWLVSLLGQEGLIKETENTSVLN